VIPRSEYATKKTRAKDVASYQSSDYYQQIGVRISPRDGAGRVRAECYLTHVLKPTACGPCLVSRDGEGGGVLTESRSVTESLGGSCCWGLCGFEGGGAPGLLWRPCRAPRTNKMVSIAR
jgi:hypothetical protein